MNFPMTIVKMKSIPNLSYGNDAKIFKTEFTRHDPSICQRPLALYLTDHRSLLQTSGIVLSMTDIQSMELESAPEF